MSRPEIDLKNFTEENRSKIELEDQTYIPAY
jgi:hypothetical protein